MFKICYYFVVGANIKEVTMITIVFILSPFVAILLVSAIYLLNRNEDKTMLKSMRANHAIKLKEDKAFHSVKSRKKKYHL